jgi:hypothetical protein
MPRRPREPVTLNLEIRKKKKHFISSKSQQKRNIIKIKEELVIYNNYLRTYGNFFYY